MYVQRQKRTFLYRAAMICAVSLSVVCGIAAHRDTVIKLAAEQDAADAINGMLRTISFGYAIIDENLHVIVWNPAMEEMTGWTEAELRGKEVDIIMPEAVRQQHRKALLLAFANKSSHRGKVAVVNCKIIPKGKDEALPVKVTARVVRSRTGHLFAIAHVDDMSKIVEVKGPPIK